MDVSRGLLKFLHDRAVTGPGALLPRARGRLSSAPEAYDLAAAPSRSRTAAAISAAAGSQLSSSVGL
jgi:hypothetical protein